MPSLSVVVPVHNGAVFLEECIASIRAQTLAASEIIVVDDGSSDGSGALAARLGARVLRQDNAGPASARNRGIAAASGDWLAFLDADDVWPPDSLERRALALEASGAEIVHGDTEWRCWQADESRWQTLEQTSQLVFISAILFRRSAFERIGRFDESMRFSEDVDWCLRAHDARLPRARVDAVVHEYRIHGGNMTLSAPKKQRDLFAAMHRSVQRKKALAEGA